MSDVNETDLFAHLAGIDSEDAEGRAFMSGLSEASRLHRAALALAEEAFLLGEHVDEQEAPAQAALLAAQDSAHVSTTGDARYGDGRLLVWLRPIEGGFEAIQESGPPGVALQVASLRVPLQRDVPQAIPGLETLPDQLVALDRRGRRVVLERMTPS
jgi:hypothetical protein